MHLLRRTVFLLPTRQRTNRPHLGRGLSAAKTLASEVRAALEAAYKAKPTKELKAYIDALKKGDITDLQTATSPERGAKVAEAKAKLDKAIAALKAKGEAPLYQVEHTATDHEKMADLKTEATKAFEKIKNPTQDQRDMLRLINETSKLVSIKRKDAQNIINVLISSGYQSINRFGENVGEGLLHIVSRHYGTGAEGELSAKEILNIGKTIIDGKALSKEAFIQNKNAASQYRFIRGYERQLDNGAKFTVVVGVDKSGVEHTITYYSNRGRFSENDLSKPTTQIQDKLATGNAPSGKAANEVSISKLLQKSQEGTNGLPKGMIDFVNDMGGQKAVMTFFKSSDVSTAVHETGHYFRPSLDEKELAHAEMAFDVKDGHWTPAHEEAFAEGFTKYISDGKAQTPALQDIFEKMKQWLLDLWAVLKGTKEQNFELTGDMKTLYNAMMGDAKAKAELSSIAEREFRPEELQTSGKDSGSLGHSTARSFGETIANDMPLSQGVVDIPYTSLKKRKVKLTLHFV